MKNLVILTALLVGTSSSAQEAFHYKCDVTYEERSIDSDGKPTVIQSEKTSFEQPFYDFQCWTNAMPEKPCPGMVAINRVTLPNTKIKVSGAFTYLAPYSSGHGRIVIEVLDSNRNYLFGLSSSAEVGRPIFLGTLNDKHQFVLDCKLNQTEVPIQ